MLVLILILNLIAEHMREQHAEKYAREHIIYLDNGKPIIIP